MLPRDAGIPDPTSNPPASRRHPGPVGGPVAGRVGAPAAPARPAGPPARPPALAAAPDLPALVRSFRRRWLLAVCLGFVVAGGAAAAAWTLLSPKYTAFGQVRVSATPRGPVISEEGEGRHVFNTYLRTQAAQLRGRFVLNAALNNDEVKRLHLEHKHGPTTEDVVTWLEEELQVDFQNDNEWVRVSLACDDPDEATALVNAVLSAFYKEVIEKENTRRADDVSALDRLYTKTAEELRAKKETLNLQSEGTMDSAKFKIKHDALMTTFSMVNTEYLRVSSERSRLQSRLDTQKARAKALDTEPIPDVLLIEAADADPEIRADQARINKVQELIRSINANFRNPSLSPKYGPAVRELKQLEKKVAARREKLKKELVASARQKARAAHDSAISQLSTEVVSLAAHESALRAEVKRLTEEALAVEQTTATVDSLKREVARGEELVARLGTKLQQDRLALQGRPRVEIAQRAALLAKDMKKQVLATGLAAVAGLFATAFLVALWEFRRRRIQTPDEVATGLGIRVVGAVPASPYVEQMINAAPEEQAEEHLLESIDGIRTLLVHNSSVEAARVLMVTSAGPGEAKTTLASHLAGSLARAGRKTLLIDGDLRQPAVHQIFELSMQPGFSEVLLGEVDTVDAIVPTGVDGLMVLPAGQWDREVIQSLARGGAQGIFEKLKEEFDFILVDSHPVLSATDSLLIGQSVDAVILAVLRDVSQTPQVYAASQRLTSLGIRVLGAVVNGTDPDAVYAPAAAHTPAAA